MNRVLAHTGVQYPIVQAPMGYIARSQLASAVSNAGGLGIIETSSGEVDACLAEIAKMKELTDKPFGVKPAAALHPRAEGRRPGGEVRREVRHHLGGLARQAAAHAEGGGAHRLSRRAQSLVGAEGGRGRRRRADRRRRRGRWLQESRRGLDARAAAGGAGEDRRADDRGRRHLATVAAWRRPLRWARRASRWARAS